MEISQLLKEQLEIIKPSNQEIKEISEQTKNILEILNKNIKKNKLLATPFIGGSFAKNTLIKKQKYDIDVFIRFNAKYNEKELSNLLKKIVPKKSKVIHGSRDYYSFKFEKSDIIFEIVPTINITNPLQAKNITDLSYFHVKYVNNQVKTNPKLADEIRLAKAFAYYQDCYGAESYINGFSGYAVELLVIYYKGFMNFIRAMAKASPGLVIDMAKHYKKGEAKLKLNKSKIQSPIILVDPTFKERNALAALSFSTFQKFQKVCKTFIKHPSAKFFVLEDKEESFTKKHKEKLVKIRISTSKQAGDIAGTKLKKFYRYFVQEAEKMFDIVKHDFDYNEAKNMGTIFFVVEPKKQIKIMGPPIKMKKALAAFKRKHRKIVVSAGRACAAQNPVSFEKFLVDFKKAKKKVIREMSAKFK